MVLPKRFQTASQPIASYDYTDIEEGTGVVVLYGMNSVLSGGTMLSLLKTPIYSGTIASTQTPTTSWAKKGDYDFDLTFNTPKRIKGKVRIAVTNVYKGSADGTTYSYLRAYVKHYDGTDETSLGDVYSTTGSAQSATVGSTMHNLEIDVAETHFKTGETFRVTIEVWGKTASGAGAFVGIAHDPKDRDDGTILEAADSSQMEVHIPFVFEV